jgi:hypothetical protein
MSCIMWLKVKTLSFLPPIWEWQPFHL